MQDPWAASLKKKPQCKGVPNGWENNNVVHPLIRLLYCVRAAITNMLLKTQESAGRPNLCCNGGLRAHSHLHSILPVTAILHFFTAILRDCGTDFGMEIYFPICSDVYIGILRLHAILGIFPRLRVQKCSLHFFRQCRKTHCIEPHVR